MTDMISFLIVALLFPGGARRRGGADRHPGHGGAGGLRGHPRQLLPLRRGLPLRVLHHGAGELRRHAGVQVRKIVRSFGCLFWLCVDFCK